MKSFYLNNTVIDAVPQSIDLEPMIEPFVIFVAKVPCLALNLMSWVLIQTRYPVGSVMGIKSESLASRTKKMGNQRQVDESGELKHQAVSSSAILGPNGND